MPNVAFETSDQAGLAWNDPCLAVFEEEIADTRNAGTDKANSDAVSEYEISELVFGALQDAMLAAARPCPDTYIEILESRKRNSIVARIDELPTVQLSHPALQAEVLKEIAMTRAQRELANEILKVIRYYARSKRHAVMAAMI